ncbi:hypothetical protein [Flavilitoribacter nigricans]|uniref:Uncharacterized protein n=1 Tax=Flavilitoribacter nigricans (strain ATCC 23147 / DSM 23189 / NBRC 102662 / NCIMB 1420 / SS-2) TaxID=1122177 RepID=A0A2D0NHQ3_FLAN2|nr:hypothetical protein [Flavilitoribacter nigricans]PHN07699.1 hypothetical protein CRP01_06255 [Flavilitoribacter nigricans DSM 23189 = NBRC 102662]
MKRRTDLYELIRAMSKSEKRYFTIDAQKTGRKGSRYLELFQAINDMEDDDEKALRKQFGRNLSTDKNYLYEAIMRSMRDYRSANSLAARIREMILDAKYLSERGLYDQCQERLQNAKDLAEKLDDNLGLLEILKEERRLVRDRRSKSYEQVVEQLSEESSEVLQRITDEMWYLAIYEDLVNIVLQKFRLSDEKDIERVRAKFYPQLVARDPEMISPGSRRRFYQCWALYSQLLGNFDDVFQYYEKVIDWWDKHPLNKEEEFHKYIVDISNYLHGYATKGQYQYFPKLIESMENARPKNLHDKSLVFQKISIYKLMYFINTGENRGLDAFLETVEKGLSTYFISPGSQLVLLFNTAILLFIQEDFQACKKWCEKIFAKKKVSSRIDIQRAGRLLYLICEYEIDDLDGPEKALRSVNRYFQINDQVQEKSEFENLITTTVHKLIFVPIMEKQRTFQTLIEEIKAQGERNKVPLGLDELCTIWATGKIKKKQMAQLLNQ